MTKKSPDVFVIAFALIVLAAVATWVLPGGAYERRQEKIGDSVREVVVPGSFRSEPAKPQIAEVFLAPIQGFMRFASIVAFIFLVGGAFNILNDTGAVASGTRWLVRLLGRRTYLVIPFLMTTFSVFGGAFGMCEEAIPLALVFVPLAIALGYDSIVGVCLTFVAAGVGFAAGFLNPFTVQIAQGIAGIRPASGLGYRLVVWAVFTAVTIAWVMIYAARVKADPRRSPMYDVDQPRREELASAAVDEAAFAWRHGVCIALLFGAIGLLVYGVTGKGWYITELAGLFLAMGVLSGVAAGFGPDRIAKSFMVGAKDIAGAALIVAFAGGIVVILENGLILDRILYAMASVTSRLGGVVAAQAMFVLQTALNFFIPSGSTKAVLTMPLLAPLGDLSGISRQTVVLAYQLGAGLTSMIIPTSGVTVGTLTLAKIPYERWVKWFWPMQAAFFVLSLLVLIWPVLAHWS
jgi:uncharacterized ion transporter superfamily protein YfcC